MYFFRDFASNSIKESIRQLRFNAAGYKRNTSKIADISKGFLITRGYKAVDYFEPTRINKSWLTSNDIIFTMDRFLRRDILFQYFPLQMEVMELRILTLSEAAGITDKIIDLGDDPSEDFHPVFNLLERCCRTIIQKIEAEN